MALKAAGRTQDAKAELNRAVELRADYPEALVALGDMLVAEKNYEMAIPTYRDALRLRPDDPTLHSRLAGALRENGDMGGAATESQEAARLDPSFAGYQRDLGNALYNKGDYKGAVEAFRASLARRNDAQTQENLGLALEQLADWRSASDAFREALKAAARLVRGAPEPFHRSQPNERHGRLRGGSASGPATHPQSPGGPLRPR